MCLVMGMVMFGVITTTFPSPFSSSGGLMDDPGRTPVRELVPVSSCYIPDRREGLVNPEEAPFAGTAQASLLLPGADTAFSSQFLTIKKRSNVESELLSSGASH
jgi:hypothetical protein